MKWNKMSEQLPESKIGIVVDLGGDNEFKSVIFNKCDNCYTYHGESFTEFSKCPFWVDIEELIAESCDSVFKKIIRTEKVVKRAGGSESVNVLAHLIWATLEYLKDITDWIVFDECLAWKDGQYLKIVDVYEAATEFNLLGEEKFIAKYKISWEPTDDQSEMAKGIFLLDIVSNVNEGLLLRNHRVLMPDK